MNVGVGVAPAVDSVQAMSGINGVALIQNDHSIGSKTFNFARGVNGLLFGLQAAVASYTIGDGAGMTIAGGMGLGKNLTHHNLKCSQKYKHIPLYLLQYQLLRIQNPLP
ncbi:unnamed protein product, partial [marine sediment metagenome]